MLEVDLFFKFGFVAHLFDEGVVWQFSVQNKVGIEWAFLKHHDWWIKSHLKLAYFSSLTPLNSHSNILKTAVDFKKWNWKQDKENVAKANIHAMGKVIFFFCARSSWFFGQGCLPFWARSSLFLGQGSLIFQDFHSTSLHPRFARFSTPVIILNSNYYTQKRHNIWVSIFILN